MDPRSREWPAQWGAQLDRAGGGRRFNSRPQLCVEKLFPDVRQWYLVGGMEV